MDLRVLVLIIVALLNLIFGSFIYLKDRKNYINIFFGLLALGLVGWSIGVANVYLENPQNVEVIFFWYKFLYFFGSVAITSFFGFSWVFPSEGSNPKNRWKFLLYLPTLVILILLVFSNLLLKEAFVDANHKGVILGPAYLFYFLLFFACIGGGHILLIKKYLKASGLARSQLFYVFLGTVAPGTVSAIGNIILPTIGNFRHIWLGPTPCFLMILCFSYAILRYRLMDIRVTLGRTAVYIFSFLTVIGLGFLLMFFNNQLENPLPLNTFLPLAIVITVLFYQLFFRLFERLASKYFYYTFYSYQKVLTDLGEQLSRILDLKRLSALIVETLQKTMKLDRTVVLLRGQTGRYVILRSIGFKEENGISLVKDSFFTEFLQKTRNPLVFEELSLFKRDTTSPTEKASITKLQENMKRIEAGVCLPLFRGEDLNGLIVLGKKISGDAYSKEDLELLIVLANQASIALENARLYDEVQDLSQNLQDKVTKQTKELRVAYTGLKRIDELKSEFLGMASHQLRTPLTAIKGYLSMALEGDYGKVSDKLKDPLNKVFASSNRLAKIVSDLLDISRIDLGKMQLNRTKVHIEDLLRSCYEEMKVGADQKQLKYIYQPSKTPLPQLFIDESKFRQLILNLIDNAIRYTKQGTVTLSVKQQDNTILIKVQDTGEGLTKEEQKNIFESFSRGTAGINYFIEGVGLGLYVSRKYLELHQGKIWAESPGKGKGSAFYVELPIR